MMSLFTQEDLFYIYALVKGSIYISVSFLFGGVLFDEVPEGSVAQPRWLQNKTEQKGSCFQLTLTMKSMRRDSGRFSHSTKLNFVILNKITDSVGWSKNNVSNSTNLATKVQLFLDVLLWKCSILSLKGFRLQQGSKLFFFYYDPCVTLCVQFGFPITL